MARLEAKPWPGFEHRPGEDWRAYGARIDAELKKIEAEHTVVRFPIADGCAMYTVVSEKPLVLRHIPYGDAYQAMGATIRGFTLADLRRQQKFDKLFDQRGDENEAFYESLCLGQVVHYHHGFNEFVRCEVVEEGGKRALLPFALVGAWRPHDLPRRMPDGSVHLGYSAKEIRDRKTMRPHSSNVWECPKYFRRPDALDPKDMAPVDLSVPEMDAEEAERARLWRKVDALRKALEGNKADADPAEILERARALLAA